MVERPLNRVGMRFMVPRWNPFGYHQDQIWSRLENVGSDNQLEGSTLGKFITFAILAMLPALLVIGQPSYAKSASRTVYKVGGCPPNGMNAKQCNFYHIICSSGREWEGFMATNISNYSGGMPSRKWGTNGRWAERKNICDPNWQY
jgi:hypothetical protein